MGGDRRQQRNGAARADFAVTTVVAPNLHRNYTGVTATIASLVPIIAKSMPIASLGPSLPPEVPVVGWRDVLLRGWRPPVGAPHRIWHARRNIEMAAGIVLRDVLRQPWKLIFTSAAQRRHSWLTRFMYHRMDAVIATSPEAAGYLEVPATVIMHGVDTDRFHPTPVRLAAWAETGLPGRYGIGAFGRIKPVKGTDRFVDAMIALLPRYPDFTAVISGQITPDNRGYLDAMKAKIDAAGLTDRIVFLGDLPFDDIPLWFRRVSVYVAPMRWEGYGLTPLEAMASGAAVVATRTGAAPRLVRDGETGWLVDADDDTGLVAALNAAMGDMDGTQRMGRAGRTITETRHAIREEAAAICRVYDRLLRTDHPSS